MAHSSQHDTLCVDYCSVSCGWMGRYTDSESALIPLVFFFFTFLFVIEAASMMVVGFLPIGFNESEFNQSIN